MASYNKVILMGNLTRDPELKTLPSQTVVCDFSLAVNRRWKDANGADREEVLFIDCAAFGKTGASIAGNLAKGRPIHIEGCLRLEQWEQEDGQRRSKIRVVVEQFRFVDRKPGIGTAFLILDPDGSVRREYRVPRSRRSPSGNSNGNGQRTDGPAEAPKPPTADDLKEPQLATTFTHQALAVREALLKDAAARKRVLALILHDQVRSEALAIRHEPNGTTLCAEHTEGFASSALEMLRQRRVELDPLHERPCIKDDEAYTALRAIPDKQVNALIELLTAQSITAHLQRRTELVWRLAQELGVNVRRYWRPDEKWLASFQKIQLAALIVELRGAVYAPDESKKKSELVSELAKLFADAAEGRMEDAALATKLNEWLPVNLREEPQKESDAKAA